MVSFSVFKKIIIAIGLTTVASFSYGLQSQASEPDMFPQCIERLQQQARNAGVSDNTIINILGHVKPLPKFLATIAINLSLSRLLRAIFQNE